MDNLAKKKEVYSILDVHNIENKFYLPFQRLSKEKKKE